MEVRNRRRLWPAGLLLGVGTVGALQTLRLAYAAPETVGCPGSTLTPVINCAAVVHNPASALAGLPLGWWGLLWLVGSGLLLFWTRRPAVYSRLWAAGGLLGLLWAWVHEWASRHVCLWCTLVQTVVLVLSWFLLKPVQEVDLS